MAIFLSTICVDVSHGAKIEANSIEEAVEKAWEEFDESSPGLCHQCSNDFDAGDPYRLILCTEEGIEVYDDDEETKRIAKLEAEVDRLTKIESAAKALMGWIEAKHRPPVREEFERGAMASVRLHALADLHDALSAKDK